MRIIIDFAAAMMQFRKQYIEPLAQVLPDVFTPEALIQILHESIRQAVDAMDSDFSHYTNCIASYPRYDLFLGFSAPNTMSRLDPGVLAVFKQGFDEMALSFFFKLRSEGLFSQDFVVTLEDVGADFLVIQLFSDKGMM